MSVVRANESVTLSPVSKAMGMTLRSNGETDDEVMEDGETVRLASPGEVFDGEQRSDDVRSLSRLRSVGSQ